MQTASEMQAGTNGAVPESCVATCFLKGAEATTGQGHRILTLAIVSGAGGLFVVVLFLFHFRSILDRSEDGYCRHA